MTRISVVIPSWNDAEMLANCLAALARQERPADEIIVVDNGSTDATAAIAAASGARVVAEPLRGTLPATAAGFDAARFPVIARLDADSVPPPDWLARIERTMETRPGIAAVTGSGDFYGAGAAVRWLGRNVYLGGYFTVIGALLGHPPLFGSNFALRSSAWQRLRGRVHRTVREVHDDFDLSFALRPDMAVLYDPELRVQISARPFDSLSGLWRRIRWAYLTLRLNTAEQSARQRRAERRSWQRQGAQGATRHDPGDDPGTEPDGLIART